VAAITASCWPEDPWQDANSPMPPSIGELAVSEILRLEGGLDLLRGAIRHDDHAVRAVAISTLGRLGPRARCAVSDLLAAAEDASNPQRQQAIYALAQIPVDDPRVLLPAVLLALSDAVRPTDRRDYRSVPTGIVASRNIVDPRLVPGLRSAAQSADPFVRLYAQRALVVQGHVDDAVAELTQQMLDTNLATGSMERQKMAAESLAPLGARGVIGLLNVLAAKRPPGCTALEASSLRDAHHHAMEALRTVGPGGSDAVPLLFERLREAAGLSPTADLGERMDASLMLKHGVPALVSIDRENAVERLGALLERFATSDSGASYVLTELGALGGAARAAEPLVRRWCNDGNDHVREAANEALRRITADDSPKT
jgi:hypothetical protein